MSAKNAAQKALSGRVNAVNVKLGIQWLSKLT